MDHRRKLAEHGRKFADQLFRRGGVDVQARRLLRGLGRRLAAIIVGAVGARLVFQRGFLFRELLDGLLVGAVGGEPELAAQLGVVVIERQLVREGKTAKEITGQEIGLIELGTADAQLDSGHAAARAGAVAGDDAAKTRAHARVGALEDAVGGEVGRGEVL